MLTADERAAVRSAFGDAIDGWDRKELTGLHLGPLDALADCADALVPGTRYGYGAALGERRCLGLGWSMLEPEGVWTDGERADLFFTVPDGGEYAVSLDASFFLPAPGAALRLRIEANGAEVFRATCLPDQAGPRTVACDPARFAAGAVQRLTIHVDPARSPLDYGLSHDDRRLGLLLHGLRLTRA